MDHTRMDFYRILELHNKRHQSISQVELRQAYKQALLHHHPDKRNAATKPKETPDAVVPTVDEITKAYQTLADPKLQAAYDQQCKAEQEEDSQNVNTRHTGMEVVDLEDLDFDDGSGIWSKPCRCGNQPAFVVTEAELEKNVEYGELMTGCKGCSLWLKVLFSVAD